MPEKSTEPNNGSDPPDPHREQRSRSRLTAPTTPGLPLQSAALGVKRSSSERQPKQRVRWGQYRQALRTVRPLWELSRTHTTHSTGGRSAESPQGWSELKGHSLVFYQRNRCQRIMSDLLLEKGSLRMDPGLLRVREQKGPGADSSTGRI